MNGSDSGWHRLPGARRAHQVVRVARADGPRTLAVRGLRAAASRLDAPTDALPVRAEEILASTPKVPRQLARRAAASGPLTVNWVMTPPPPGSGGHTTLLRLVEYLERAGHTCRLYLYDRFGGDVAAHTRVLRRYWPQVRAEVADATGTPAPADAVFATSWQTAYLVARPSVAGRRFYAVQDFEPSFHPAGSEALLAEATYRFGFHGITAGAWLAGKLRDEYGMPCDHFEFGADTGVYRLDDPAALRRGVVFYAKPSTPRRAYALGLLALTEFHRRHPDEPIHLFGEDVGALPFPATRHGVITPVELAALYNRCRAGLCLSATNMSLIPFEMLAAGCVPVVNDAPHNRLVLDNPCAAYAPPTPSGLADALSAVVGGRAATPAEAAASVAAADWDAAGAAVERVLLRELRPARKSSGRATRTPVGKAGR